MKMTFGLALALFTPLLSAPSISGVRAVVTQEDDAGDELEGLTLEQLVEKVKSERDDVDIAVLDKIAEFESREAMQALLAAYEESLSSIYMRRAAAVRLAEFDDVPDAFQPALEKLASIATNESTRELRTAAIEALGRAPENGRTFLALVVESGAQDQIRERAMELHVRLGGEDDHPWYRKIYERSPAKAKKEAEEAADKKDKRGRRRRGDEEEEQAEREEIVYPTQKLRAIAMKAIIGKMEIEELETAIKSNLRHEIGREALRELSRRDIEKANEYAEEILSRSDFPASIRVLGSEIYVKSEGPDAAKELIDIATKSMTKAIVRRRIAELLSAMEDEGVDKQLTRLVGKGKGQEKAFSIRATQHIDDEKIAKKVRRMLKDRDPVVAIAAIEAVASRKDREAIEDMEKLLERSKSDEVREALLEGLSTIYDGENTWVERLEEFAKADDVDMRNAALIEIARLGRSNTDDVFLEALKHPNWSTRLVALEALVDRRESKLVAPIVERMQEETGRMAIEFGDALFRLTGESFGSNASTWDRWLADQGDSIAIIDESEVDKIREDEEERRLKQISDASFFGIRIVSHRVLFIIDVSGSMNEPLRARYADEQGEPRIEVAKRELKTAIEALDDNAFFNITPFSSGVESWLEEGVASSAEKTRAEALEYTDRLGAMGGTNLYGSLESAFTDLDIDTIFVLSDGEPSVGDIIDTQLIRDAVAEMNATRKVVINTIAIGGSFEILEWLAEDSGGTHVEFQ